MPSPATLDLAAGRGPSWLDAWLSTNGANLIAWRRNIHARPELAYHEHGTTALIIGSTMRGDIDALPFSETTGLPFASAMEDVMHACGHDAHTAILIGAALALAPALPGRIRVIFQPAEEAMLGGALDLLAADGLPGVEWIFALHGDPRLPVGRVGTRSDRSPRHPTCSSYACPCPAGTPPAHTFTADLVHALGTVITGLPALPSRRVDARSGTVLVWGTVQAGQAANTVPQQGLLRGTLRTGDRDIWADLELLVRELVTTLLAPTGVGFDLKHIRGVPPVINEPGSTRLLHDGVASAVPGAWHCTEVYANNRLEADHGQLKRRLRPMRSLKTDQLARIIIAGHIFIQNIRGGHYGLGVDEPMTLRVMSAFDELALAI